MVRRASDLVITHPILAYGLAIANFIGFLVGTIFWYGDFFAQAHPPLWSYPFIPDCPLAAGVFGLAIITLHHKRSNNLLNQFAAVFNIKYGTWTMTFWWLYWSRTGDFDPISILMFVTHLGLTIQGLLILQYLHKPNLRDTVIVMLWFVASDVIDYAPIAPDRGGYGWYPPLPLGTQLVPAMQYHAIFMTMVLNGALMVRVLVNRLASSSAEHSTIPK